jgi:hypothetical protein
MRWRIYYGDGGTFSNRDGSPFSAPAVNVQVVAIEYDNERGFGLMHGSQDKGVFCWRGDDYGWQVMDVPGFYDYLMTHLGPCKVIFGRTIRDDEFWKIVGRAGREGVGE